MTRVVVWLRRARLWLVGHRALVALVAALQARLDEVCRGRDEQANQFRRELAVIRGLHADVVAGLRVEAVAGDGLLRDARAALARERAYGNRMAHRLRRLDALADSVPADVAALIRRETRPFAQPKEESSDA